MNSSAERRALDIEAQLEEYPDERGEILLEAAQAWSDAGNPTRAVEIWESLVELGGEDGCWARCELASHHLGAGDAAAAYEQIRFLARDPATSRTCPAVSTSSRTATPSGRPR